MWRSNVLMKIWSILPERKSNWLDTLASRSRQHLVVKFQKRVEIQDFHFYHSEKHSQMLPNQSIRIQAMRLVLDCEPRRIPVTHTISHAQSVTRLCWVHSFLLRNPGTVLFAYLVQFNAIIGKGSEYKRKKISWLTSDQQYTLPIFLSVLLRHFFVIHCLARRMGYFSLTSVVLYFWRELGLKTT